MSCFSTLFFCLKIDELLAILQYYALNKQLFLLTIVLSVNNAAHSDFLERNAILSMAVGVHFTNFD